MAITIMSTSLWRRRPSFFRQFPENLRRFPTFTGRDADHRSSIIDHQEHAQPP
jgi:hypothetical protein